MPASSLAQILIRVVSLHWMMSGVIQLSYIIFMYRLTGFDLTPFLAPAVYILVGLAIWKFAPAVAKAAARGNDGEITLRGVTPEQLCATALMVLGFYFAMNNIGSTFSGIFQYAMSRNVPQELQTQPFDFFNSLATVVAGVILIVVSRKLAAKLFADRPREQGE